MKKQNKRVGSFLDDFLQEEGMLEEARSIAIKEAIAWQVQEAMVRENLTMVEMAKRMRTSRAALDRLLDPGMARLPCRRSRVRRTRSGAVCALSLFESS